MMQYKCAFDSSKGLKTNNRLAQMDRQVINANKKGNNTLNRRLSRLKELDEN